VGNSVHVAVAVNDHVNVNVNVNDHVNVNVAPCRCETNLLNQRWLTPR
jgi:hypothetical protein